MNIVAPEIAALRFFWDKLATGAVVLLDDYNFERHILQKQAMDEFAAEKGTMVIPLPTCQGMIIKTPDLATG
jgi:O-methyltransferase